MNHDLVGDRIANYDVKKKVSSDSLFDYYEAEHIFLQRKVILKTPREGIAEIEAAKAELHRQIAQPDFLHNQSSFIWDYFEDSGKVYIATEKQAERVSLEVYIAKNQHLTQEKTLRIFNQLTEIIYAAHQIGLVHLALNPKNIFIENEQLHIEAFSNTALQEENYRSPEELKSGEVSILSNIYSLGKILEFLFTNADAKLKNTNMLSHKFKEVIAIATEHNPKERFANGKEFLEALSEEVSEEEIENKNAFKGLPIVLFITFSVFFLLITFNIADEEDKKNTLAYDLYDQTRIRKSLDSIKKVRKNELIRDSIRIARNKAENLQKIHIHKVAKGETLKGIAERYNMGITHLKELNGFNDKKTLKADVGLRVIVREYHKLLDGENLVQIGQRYGVSKYEILRATGIDFADEMDEIYPGVELIIPIKK